MVFPGILRRGSATQKRRLIANISPLNCQNNLAVDSQPEPGDMSRVTKGAPSAHKMPQLDALRAFAVLSVLAVHFVAHSPRWLVVVPWAACGVQLFFVL